MPASSWDTRRSSSDRSPRWKGAAFFAAALVAVVMVARVSMADTSGSPDPNTKAALAPADPTTSGQAPGATFTGNADGTTYNIHVDTAANNLFEVDAYMCKAGLNVITHSQLRSTTGACLDQPFSANSDSFVAATSDAATNSVVNFPFRVGSGTRTWSDSGGSHTITCDASNPCAVWLDEQVATTITPGASDSGHVFKHYVMQYGTPASTSTTNASTTSTTGATTSTTTGATSTTTTAPATTTTTTAGATTTSTAPATTSTTHATTTTAPGSTSTTRATTTTTSGQSTSTTASGVTTTTTAGPSASVSPTTVAPGGSFTLTTSGWRALATLTAVLHSDPVTLGTMTADASGAASGVFSIPAGTALGAHSITVSGTDPAGSDRTVTVSITVASATSSSLSSSASSSSGGSSSSSGSSSSGLSRTGATIGRTISLALVFLGIGFILYGRTRRSRTAKRS